MQLSAGRLDVEVRDCQGQSFAWQRNGYMQPDWLIQKLSSHTPFSLIDLGFICPKLNDSAGRCHAASLLFNNF